MLLATAWYSPSSPTLWTDLLAIAGIIATVIAGREALPKRRLRCAVVSRTRLMNAPQVVRDNLKVLYMDQALTDPYILVFEIASTGRSAIPSSSFDNGRSLQLELAAEIKTILSMECSPPSATKPVIEDHGGVLELKPELIARREIINLSMLTEGNPGPVTISLNPFTDVKVDSIDQEAIRARRDRRAGIAAFSLGFLTLVVSGISIYLTAHEAGKGTAIASSALCIATSEFAENTDLGMELVYRDITVHRTFAGTIQSIKFAPNYNADVGVLEDAARFLLADYRAANTAEADRLSSRVSRVLALLPNLPKEGASSTASHDIAAFKAVMSQISNPSISVPGCPS